MQYSISITKEIDMKHLVSTEFGYPLYVANSDLGIQVTDQISEAEVFDSRDGQVKADYWGAVVGVKFQYRPLTA